MSSERDIGGKTITRSALGLSADPGTNEMYCLGGGSGCDPCFEFDVMSYFPGM